MAWNIGLLCIKAEKDKVDEIFDIFYKSKEGLFLEDAASVMMGQALGIGYYEPWIIVVDTLGRFITNPSFPEQLSRKYKLKIFWISESLVYRDYNFEDGKSEVFEIKGKGDGLQYLNSQGIKKVDGWGETIAFQIIENEIFGKKRESHGTSLMDIKYSKYELD